MALSSSQIKLLIDSLNESLIAIEFCIKYDKIQSTNWLAGDSGCMGIPAMILICSIIDTMGSYFRGSSTLISIDGTTHRIETAENHFYILNHEHIFNLNLKKVTIEDFYSTYRSKLTHNSSLPENNFLSIGTALSDVFELERHDKIVKVNLLRLFNETKTAVTNFSRIFTTGTLSSNHKVTNELKEHAKPLDPTLKLRSSDTGRTQTII